MGGSSFYAQEPPNRSRTKLSHPHAALGTQANLYWDLGYRGARLLPSPAPGETDPDINQHDKGKNKAHRQILIQGERREISDT